MTSKFIPYFDSRSSRLILRLELKAVHVPQTFQVNNRSWGVRQSSEMDRNIQIAMDFLKRRRKLLTFSLSFFIFGFILIYWSQEIEEWACAAPNVATSNGIISGITHFCGIKSLLHGYSKSYYYIGIPYAEPPLGDLRFKVRNSLSNYISHYITTKTIITVLWIGSCA